MELIITIVIVVGMLGGSYLIYWYINRIRQNYIRDEFLRMDNKIKVVNIKTYPEEFRHVEARLVTGSVAIANCYFISFFSSWKKIFGGELKMYGRLATDARKLALIRLMQDAEQWGAEWVFNVRYETSMQETTQKQSGQVHGLILFAYATAVRPCREKTE